jgi:hypothetical protein
MYKINTKPNQKRDKFNNITLENDTFILNNNNYKNNNIINEDINKMHLLPPYCPMTPTSYTDFFSDNTTLSSVEPYKTELVKHPKDGYIHKIEYNHFYNDFKKDALHYTDNNYEFINNTNNHSSNTNNNSNNTNNHSSNTNKYILNDNNDVKLYNETKHKRYNDFAVPMSINGSNKVKDLYDNCKNKKTFEYKRYSTIAPHHKQWIDNPLFIDDISIETETLKTKFVDNRETHTMDIYSDVFQDMYAMTM